MTVITGVASLAFNGVATYYGARVAQEQLQQSIEDADKQSREQAGRVTYWLAADESEFDGRLYIANRSSDPVTNVSISVSRGSNSGSVNVGAVPPCSKLIIEWKKSFLLPEGAKRADVKVGPELTFADSDGIGWIRTPSSLRRYSGTTSGSSTVSEKFAVQAIPQCESGEKHSEVE
ncbi:hypothetical protein [Streptomyces sp. NPDC053720]|uniref:hypothetical protein n=1 Tax=Streptomyces sp. NPDC053720 TaxID=3154855 RepID=UPI003430C124